MTLESQAYIRWLDSEGEILMNGFNVLMREIPDISLAFYQNFSTVQQGWVSSYEEERAQRN